MQTNDFLARLLEEVRKIRQHMQAYGNQTPQQLPSGQRPDDDFPEHVDVTTIVEYFNISKSTFYNEVEGKLLKPVLNIGRRPYYLKSDVTELMKRNEKKHPGIKKWYQDQQKRVNKR